MMPGLPPFVLKALELLATLFVFTVGTVLLVIVFTQSRWLRKSGNLMVLFP
jgi:hypothetical protein